MVSAVRQVQFEWYRGYAMQLVSRIVFLRRAFCIFLEVSIMNQTMTGMDFKIRCTKCGHEIMMPRHKCEKGIKKILEEV